MKLLTLTIDSKFNHVINFDNPDTCSKTFIIENKATQVEVLRLPRQASNSQNSRTSYVFQTDEGEQKLYMSKFKIDDKVTGDQRIESVISVELTTDLEGPKNSPVDAVDERWLHDHMVSQCVGNRVYEYTFMISLNVYDKHLGKAMQYKHEVRVDIVPPGMLYDVVLDYGSEASQMLSFRRDAPNMGLNDRMPVFDMFSLMLDEKENPEEYLQYSAEDSYLYRSHFFVKREIGDGSLDRPYLHPKQNPNVRLMTSVTSLEEIGHTFTTMNNVKISAHGGSLDPIIKINQVPWPIGKVGENYFYRATINPFIHAALKNVVADPINTKFRYVSVFVLMPNVYDQKEASIHLRQLEEDAQEILKLPEYENIKGIAFHSISESDASFLGYCASCSAHNADASPIEPGNYLIMDAGKGTLDFSILEYLSEPEPNSDVLYRNLYRSGIVGSGNAITYAFMQSLLKELYSPFFSGDNLLNKISSFISNEVIGADQAHLRMLTKLLEEYKKNYNDNKLSSGDWTGGLESPTDCMSLNGFNNWLMANMSIALKDDSVIEDMIDRIVSETISKFPSEVSVNKVIFSGRGFLMNKLREKMLAKLAERFPGIQELNVNSSFSMKNICMFISNFIYNGHYDGYIFGVPLIEFPDNANATAVDTKKKRFSFDFLERYVRGAAKEGIVGGQLKNEPASQCQKRNFLIHGKDVSLKRSTANFTINGVTYQINGSVKGKVKLLFDGEKFLFWESKGKIKMFSPYVDPTNNMAFESMFPYSLIPQGGIVPVSQVAQVVKPIVAASGGSQNAGLKTDKRTDSDLTNELSKRNLL